MLSCVGKSARMPSVAASAVRSMSTKAGMRPGLTPTSKFGPAPSRLAQQVRFVRQSPFQRPNLHNQLEQAYPGASGTGSNAGAQSSTQGWTKALTSVGVIAATAIGANLFFNRKTRNGGLSLAESNYLNSTFSYLGGGLTITGATAYALHRYGFSARLMSANPWLVLGVGLVASIGGMIGATSLPSSHPLKGPAWLLFNVSQAAVLSPLFFFNPAILARAGLYTAGLMGSLCYVAATAKEDQFLYLGGPLLAGVTIVALSSLAPMILPATAVRTLVASEAISLYGGLAVFGAFVLWDTQKVLQHAKQVEAGMRPSDPLAESIGLELDFINIFTRLVQILAARDQRRR
ncbi:hypothetical protein MYAM1_003011 [Malassezia yamatoensis]|uniref:Growth hormone-inducible transmembrane protein n=1 Tax=Malassezia yamatoensis TaxID=253288 RepID=A0AAJ5YUZ5_9BASI|nr:hypothetical protein MYAM1_003011 [Malassezia yamatoensis]